MCLWYYYTHKLLMGKKIREEMECAENWEVGMLAVEAPRFRKGSGAKEDSSPASSLVTL
jgi:hypothetical protein